MSLSHRNALSNLVSYLFPARAFFRRPRAARNRRMRGQWFEFLEERTLFDATSVSNISKIEALNGTSVVIAPSDFSAAFTDPNAGFSLTQIEFTSLPTHGTLTFNGGTVPQSQFISVANVTYTQAVGYTGADSFSWIGQDGTNAPDGNAATINIAIPPVAQSFHATVTENVPFNFSASDFTNNFIDGSNGTLLQDVEITLLPTHGNLALNGSSVSLNTPIAVGDLANLTYTPDANYTSSDSFAWNGSDDGTTFAASSGTVTLAIPNLRPSVSDITIPVYKDNPTSFNATEFEAGFADTVTNLSLTQIQIITLPANGTLTLNGNAVAVNDNVAVADLANLTYTPNNGTTGTDTFQWNATDGNYSALANANVTLAITVPTLTAISKAGGFQQPVTFTWTDFQNAFTDAVANASLQAIDVVTLPPDGTLMLGNVTVTANETITAADFGNLTLTYQPNPNFSGVDTFTWNATDGFNSADSSANVSISVATPFSVANVSLTEPRHATSETFTQAEFASGFTDSISGDTLQSIEITALPTFGNLTLGDASVTVNEIIPADSIANLTYTQTAGYVGTDSFGWDASNGTGTSNSSLFSGNPALMTLTIPANTAPTVTSVTVTTKENTPLTFSTDVFAPGFADVDAGDSLQQLTITTLPIHGTLTLNGTTVTANQTISAGDIASLIYTPTTGYVGNDAFGWNASDGQDFALTPAAIAISIPGVGTISETEALHATSQTFASTDFSAVYGTDLQTIEITSLPTNGKLTLAGAPVTVNETIAVGNISSLVYTQNNGFAGTDAFGWNGTNGATFTATPASVFITIPADARPTLTPITAVTSENLAAPFSATTFTNGFTDTDTGDALQTIQITSLPSHGKLTLGGAVVTVGQSIAAANIGALAYTPAAGFVGSDSFGWNASDGFLAAASAAKATVTVAAPTASNISKAGTPNSPQTLLVSDFTTAFSDVVAGDTAATVQILSLPAHGTLTLAGQPVKTNQVVTLSSGTTLTYTPAAGYVGTDAFRYNASDGHASTAAATVNFIVDDAPTIAPVNKAVVENEAQNFTLSDFSSQFSDSDAGAKLQAIQITSLPANGTLTLNGVVVTVNQTIASGNISGLTYTPTGGQTGADSFGWNGSDGLEFAAMASTVNIAINALPELSTITLPEPLLTGTSLTFNADDFTGGFTDTNTGAALQSVRITALPAHGTLTLGNAKVTANQVIAVANLGSLVYTPKAGFLGEDSFGWTGSDGFNFAPGAATVQIAVVPLFSVLGNGSPILNGQKAPAASNFTDFGSWTILPDASMGPDTRTYTIVNSGSAAINLGAITLSNTADFTLVNAASVENTTLAAGASVALTVQFNPTVVGKRTATLSIANSSAGSPLFTFAIQGTALHTTAISTAVAAAGGLVQEGTTKNGSGVGASNGQIVTIEYTGYTTDGTVFDSSSFHGQTINGFPLRLDDDYADSHPYLTNDQTDPFPDGINNVDGGVIAGWEFGLQGIKAGETRTLIINTAAGYGGDANSTLNTSTLIFDVKCVSIVTKPKLGVVADLSTGLIVLVPGQKTASASDGTLMTIPSNASSVSQTFDLDTVGTVSSTGAALSHWSFKGVGVKITGDPKDFSLSFSATDVLVVTFHPLHPGTKTATIHVLTTDPDSPDFTFNVQGTTASYVDLVAGFSTLKLPTSPITSGTSQKIKLPVLIENIGNSPIPAKSTTNIQIYAVDAAGNKTLLTTENNVSLAGLGVNKIKHLNFTAVLPAALASGSYQFAVEVNQDEFEGAAAPDPSLATLAEVSTTNDNGTSSSGVSVVHGQYSLSGKLGASTLASSASGIAGNLSISIQNAGTIALPSGQQVSVEIVAHPVGALDASTDVVLNAGTLVTLGQLGVGASKSFKIPVNFGSALAAGQYDIEAILTPTQTLAGVVSVSVDANAQGNPLVLTA